jgi:carboxyl-terminal processing protease
MRLAMLLLTLAIAVPLAGCADKTIEAFPEKYVGIGVELRMEAAGAHVVRVLKGGAAQTAGLRRGDVILQAAGEPLRGLRLAEVVDQLRGEPGTEIALHVRGKDGERLVNVKRAVVKLD